MREATYQIHWQSNATFSTEMIATDHCDLDDDASVENMIKRLTQTAELATRPSTRYELVIIPQDDARFVPLRQNPNKVKFPSDRKMVPGEQPLPKNRTKIDLD